MPFRKSPLWCCVAIAMGLPVAAQANDSNNTNEIETIEITHRSEPSLLKQVDSILAEQGVVFSAAGGLSHLPVLNGMMGDRIGVLNDGAPVTAACANQMNPPLSYLASAQIKQINVIAAVSPVSLGGDNIAGVIAVDTFNPQFSDSNKWQWGGNIGFNNRSVNHADTIQASINTSNQDWYLNYSGQKVKAESYKDGNGNKVLDTLYEAQNHQAVVAWRDDNQQFALNLSHQSIPYQGFANQYMDMTKNNSTALTAKYSRTLSQGELSGHLSWRSVKHEMGFFSPEKTGMMPMNTKSSDIAEKLQWRTELSTGDNLIFGQEYYANQLDDWWPAVEGSMMMGPNPYININDGERTRHALYAEWEQKAAQDWYYSAGIRGEYVTTNTGDVQSYKNSPMGGMNNGGMGNMTDVDSMAAMNFNQQDRKQQDFLLDITLLANRQFDSNNSLQLGLSRKNRAPNLYERYSWGQGAMATSMIGWFGDGNGYIGNIALKPETAHTASVNYQYEASSYGLNANLWYTQVNDYIDAEVTNSFNRGPTSDTLRHILTFTNLDATLKGVTLKGNILLSDGNIGKWQLSNTLNWQDGERDDSGENLYQILPWQNLMQLSYDWNNWQSALQWQWVGKKDQVDDRRLENATGGYSLLNLNLRYRRESLTVELGFNNLLDRYYEQPLGGVNIAAFRADSSAGFAQLPGAGRSLDFGISYQF